MMSLFSGAERLSFCGDFLENGTGIFKVDFSRFWGEINRSRACGCYHPILHAKHPPPHTASGKCQSFQSLYAADTYDEQDAHITCSQQTTKQRAAGAALPLPQPTTSKSTPTQAPFTLARVATKSRHLISHHNESKQPSPKASARKPNPNRS